MYLRRFVLFAIIAFLLSTNLPGVQSKPDGISNVENGCICHSAVSSSDVEITIQGIPDYYESNLTYTFSISVSGGAEPIENATNSAGFNLWILYGFLAPVSNDTELIENSQLTHTLQGNNQRNWNVSWTAPIDDTLSVDWRLTVNTVNGDEMPSDADKWNQVSGTFTGVNGTISEPVGKLVIYGVPLGFLLISIAGYFVVTRSSRIAASEENSNQ